MVRKPTQLLPSFSRRSVLHTGIGLGAAASLSACSGGKSSSGSSKDVTFGVYQGDEVPKKAFQAMIDGHPGNKVKVNFVDQETFKANINNYLQGNPDDLFTWFAGYRARYFEQRNLVADLGAVWDKVTGMPESIKAASSTLEGKPIFIPSTYYPWGVFYRPSVWSKRGYKVPTTKDEWLALCEKMKTDGLTPLAMAASGGWEPMGTFDMLNLRVNGYEYHVSLMAGKEAWNGEKVKNVFKAWDEFTPFQQADSVGRTWQEAAQSLLNEKSGMMTMGMFIGQQFEAAKLLDDLDFFIFPEFDSAIGADVVEAPIDGFMMSAKSKNVDAARDVLSYLATPEAINRSLAVDSSVIAANENADKKGYSKLQSKAVEVIGSAKNISQFLDRDSRPDFASVVVGPALQDYLAKRSDLDTLLKSVEEQKKAIFAS